MSVWRGSISLDEFFAQFESNPEFVAERKVIRPQTNLAIHTYRLRTAAGMSRADLARAAGMTKPALSKVERGEANLRLQTVGRLAAALSVEPADLLVDPPTPAPAPPA